MRKLADVLKLLHKLSSETDPVGFAVDERTNSFIFQLDDDQQARVFEELCTLLDAETPAPGDTGKGLSVSVPALGPQPLAFDFSFGIARRITQATLRRSNELDNKLTSSQTSSINQTHSANHNGPNYKLRFANPSKLAKHLQRAELADLAQRMKSMQQSIDMRDKFAEKVVQRRVEDLLNPNLNWVATGRFSTTIRLRQAAKAIKEPRSQSELLNAERFRLSLQIGHGMLEHSLSKNQG